MSVAYAANGGPGERFLFFLCPACQDTHSVPIAGPGKLWMWNGSEDAPTLSPFVSVEVEGKTCKSTVQDGKISFPADAGHLLAGRTVALAECFAVRPGEVAHPVAVGTAHGFAV